MADRPAGNPQGKRLVPADVPESPLAELVAVFDTVPVAMSLVDTELRYIRVNAATAAMTGRPQAEHHGRTLREVNPLLDEGLEAAVRRAIATGTPCRNFRLSRPTPHVRGGKIEIILNVTAFYGATGAIAGACITATDVTEWQALQSMFFQAQKLEAVGRVAASVAHDFANLLTVIGSTCDLILLETTASDVHRADLEEIRATAERATRLARKMLGVARRRALEAVPVDLRPFLHDAEALLRRSLPPHAELVVGGGDEAPVVVADPTQMEQIVLNLVINAGDAIAGAGRITISLGGQVLDTPLVTPTGEIPAGDYAEILVADTGAGMDAGTIARIFEPFFTTKNHGTGLGLATVFAIVRDLRGGVMIESVVGQGTTFRVLLPRAREEERTGPRAVRAATAAELPRGAETLLLVDDDDILRASVARLLTRYGYRVLEATHGGEALRVLATNPGVSLVVSDVHMPGVDGRMLRERMRADGLAMPVLFTSGSSSGGAASAELPVGPATRDRFIPKPFDRSTLLETIRVMLDPVPP